MRAARFVTLALLALAIPLSGCIGSDEPAGLVVRQSGSDNQASFTVDAVSGGLRYADLLVLAEDKPFRFGPRMDHREGWFEVEGKDQPSDRVAIGDVVRLPITGSVEVEFRHLATGESLQQITLDIADHVAPPKVVLVLPTQGAAGVERQVRFEWAHVSDPSGVTYALEFWPALAGDANAPPTTMTGLFGNSFAVEPSAELLPATTYRWHVRAVDGVGNTGEWSDTWEFTTRV